VVAAVPEGASALLAWCSSTISTDSKKRAASCAKCIMRTAPMPKFGAIRQPVPGCPASQGAQRLVPLLGESGGADHGVDAVVDGPGQIVHHDVGAGEVDDDIGSLQDGAVLTGVDAADQFEILGPLDGPADLAPHPALGTEHTDLDHASPFRADNSVPRLQTAAPQTARQLSR
jgi:hypothetical protein